MRLFLSFLFALCTTSYFAQDLNQDTVKLWESKAGDLHFISGEAEAGVQYKYMIYNFKDTSQQKVNAYPNLKAIEIFNRDFLNLLSKSLSEAVEKSNRNVTTNWLLKDQKQILVNDTTELIYIINDTNSIELSIEEGKQFIEVLNAEAHRLDE